MPWLTTSGIVLLLTFQSDITYVEWNPWSCIHCCISLETADSVSFLGCLHFHIVAVCIERALGGLHMLLFSVTLRWVPGIWKCWDCDQCGPVKQTFLHCMGWRCTFPTSASCWAGNECVDSWALLTLVWSLKHVCVWQSQFRHFTGCDVGCTQCMQALSSEQDKPHCS